MFRVTIVPDYFIELVSEFCALGTETKVVGEVRKKGQVLMFKSTRTDQV